tara:strand:+ start:58 stop:498 length:441 start_codon:yes stop_codon:yes gene_type:complete
MGQDAAIHPIFARHETFHPRFGWLKKVLTKLMRNYRDDLKLMGYIVGSDLVDAKYFNVPQNRLRNILITIHSRHWEKIKSNTPETIKVPKKHPRFRKFITVEDVLGTSSVPTFPQLKPGEFASKVPNHRASLQSQVASDNQNSNTG